MDLRYFWLKDTFMSLVIPDDILKAANLSENSFRIELACWMYQKEFFTLEQGAKFASLSQMEFMKELGNRNIEWNYSTGELHEDLQNLKSLSNKK
jgi:predicted HTH domain antitoxin